MMNTRMIRFTVPLARRAERAASQHRPQNVVRTLSSLSQGRKERFFTATESVDRVMRQASSSADSSNSNASNNGSSDMKVGGAFNKIAFLGAGKMAQAFISPLISKGLQPAGKVSIFDVSVNQMKQVAAKFPGIVMAQSIPDLINDADFVVCAVKPQNINTGLFQELHKAKNIPENATFLSIAAGVPIETFLNTGYKKIVRSMPNTPAMIGYVPYYVCSYC